MPDNNLTPAAPALPAGARAGDGNLPPVLARAIELHEKAGMPWPDAEQLALSEAGADDAAIDELIGECGGLDMFLNTPEDLRLFARSALVHGSPLLAAALVPKTKYGVIDLRAIAEQAGISMDCWDMGAASLAYTEGVHGVTREHLERFAAAYGFACWNAALEANPPNMQGFVGRALDSLFQAPVTGEHL